MKYFYYINNTIADLNGEIILKEISLAYLKRNTQILVIDDDEFVYLEPLRRNEFHIVHRSDLASLSDVAEYDIILCDIRGVGKFLESTFEGAYLVKQIKEKYPNKIVISYTASSYDPRYQEYLSYADDTILKGTALEDWDSLLSRKIRELSNPVIQWEKTRNALLNANVPTVMVAKYESEYVKAVKCNDFRSLKKICENKNALGYDIMQSLLKIVEKIMESKIGG